MTITVDLATEAIRTGTGSPTTGSHGGAASGVMGVSFRIMHGTSATDHVTAASYGGVSLTRWMRTTDTVGEPGAAELWVLGSGVPQGTQTWSYTSGATTDDIHLIVETYLAAADLEVIDATSTSGDLANPSVTLKYRGRSAMAIAAMYSGQDAIASITAGTSCSTVGSAQLAGGTFSSRGLRQTTAGTTDFAIAATATIEDCAFAAVALSEVSSDPYMIYSVVEGFDGTTASVSQAIGLTLKVGDYLAMFCRHEGATTTITCSDANSRVSSWAAANSYQTHSVDGMSAQVWWGVCTAGGVPTATMTLGASRSAAGWLAVAFRAGAGNTLAVGTGAAAPASGQGTASLAINAGTATTGQKAFAFMGSCRFSSITRTPGSGWTEEFDAGKFMETRSAIPASTSLTGDATASGNHDWLAQLVVFQHPPAGAGLLPLGLTITAAVSRAANL